MDVPSQRPGEGPPGEDEPRFERITFTPEQRRLVKLLVVVALVTLAWAALAIIVVTH
jgi:hypothetical protein